MPLTVTFETDDPELSVYSLGHVTITDGPLVLTSNGRTPDQSMMIFLTVNQLIGTLEQIIIGPRKKLHEFVAVDSSFTIHFLRRNDMVRVQDARHDALTELPLSELAETLHAQAEQFFHVHEARIQDERELDLYRALQAENRHFARTHLRSD